MSELRQDAQDSQHEQQTGLGNVGGVVHKSQHILAHGNGLPNSPLLAGRLDQIAGGTEFGQGVGDVGTAVGMCIVVTHLDASVAELGLFKGKLRFKKS